MSPLDYPDSPIKEQELLEREKDDITPDIKVEDSTMFLTQIDSTGEIKKRKNSSI